MKLREALNKLDPFINRRFDSFLDAEQLIDLRTNKGNVGQILERLIGLQNTSHRLDFEDGELKTNKAHISGKPRETMFITQISNHIDEFLDKLPFEETHVYDKIKNMVYVPVCKDGSEVAWMFLPYIHINLELPEYRELFEQLKIDYGQIVEKLIYDANNDPLGYIHTSSGKYIQIRSKDSKPYHPIYSNKLGRYISNKNHAFYFKKEFMLYLQEHSPKYPL